MSEETSSSSAGGKTLGKLLGLYHAGIGGATTIIFLMMLVGGAKMMGKLPMGALGGGGTVMTVLMIILFIEALLQMVGGIGLIQQKGFGRTISFIRAIIWLVIAGIVFVIQLIGAFQLGFMVILMALIGGFLMIIQTRHQRPVYTKGLVLSTCSATKNGIFA